MNLDDKWLSEKDKQKYENVWNEERRKTYSHNGKISGKLGSMSEKDKKEYKLKIRKLDEKKSKSV